MLSLSPCLLRLTPFLLSSKVVARFKGRNFRVDGFEDDVFRRGQAEGFSIVVGPIRGTTKGFVHRPSEFCRSHLPIAAAGPSVTYPIPSAQVLCGQAVLWRSAVRSLLLIERLSLEESWAVVVCFATSGISVLLGRRRMLVAKNGVIFIAGNMGRSLDRLLFVSR